MEHRRTRLFRILAITWLTLGILWIPAPAHARTYVVNTTDNTHDGSCDARHCSIFDAIHRINGSSETSTVHFDIPGAGPHMIVIPNGREYTLQLLRNGTVLDATTQPGYSGVPLIVLVGSSADQPGLDIWANNCTIRGFSIVGFSSSLHT
jgi:hypothetical protein